MVEEVSRWKRAVAALFYLSKQFLCFRYFTLIFTTLLYAPYTFCEAAVLLKARIFTKYFLAFFQLFESGFRRFHRNFFTLLKLLVGGVANLISIRAFYFLKGQLYFSLFQFSFGFPFTFETDTVCVGAAVCY